MVIFLHGRGARTETTEKLRNCKSLLHLQQRQTAREYMLLAPHCKSGNWNEWMANELGKLPIRTFHGLCDQTADPIESLQMAKAVNNAGGVAELILFPKIAHNCWDVVYTDEKN